MVWHLGDIRGIISLKDFSKLIEICLAVGNLLDLPAVLSTDRYCKLCRSGKFMLLLTYRRRWQ